MSDEHRPIVTRFAPSPTGYLHIGGAYTALFNWLYARRNGAPEGSKFLLRIEDTDRARHDEGAVAAILEGLGWLGLDWDGEPISQHSRGARHRAVAEELLAKGAAYKCWLAGEALDEARAEARTKGIRFTSPYRDGSEGDGPYSVRLKAPTDGDTLVNDAVQGGVRFPNAVSDDTVILRSDGTPTYMLAVVTDDHDMGVTHVIRGDDHLNNTPKQQHLYEALGWPLPVFAHIPLIHGADGKKLSKRHGALGVEAYRDDGYLPDGLLNGLLRLAWSHGDQEIFTRAEALALFGLDQVNKAPGRLDPDKMAAVNSEHLAQLADEELIARGMGFLEPVSEEEERRLLRAAPFLKPRMKLLKDLPDAAAFLLAARPLALSGKAAKPLRKDGALATLEALAKELAAEEDWSAAALDASIEAFAKARDMGFGQVGPPLRAALTGGKPAPSLGETLYSLGREEALGRIGDALTDQGAP